MMLPKRPRLSKRSAIPIPVVLLSALLQFSGCSTYQNVTGYFNTYYNSRRLFEEASADARLQSQKDRDTNYFARYTVPQNTQDKFDKVIEKCSKLIQFYPKSKWVDDALLMIGESYVYLGEYESAGRKFKELLDHFPESDLRFEAKLWDAKAKYSLNQHDPALAIIKDLFPEARANGKDDILLEALMLQARIFTERSEFDQAAASYALAAEVSGDDGLRASSEYQLGVSYEKLNNKEKAAEAYNKVRKFSPPPLLDFQARLRYGIMLTATGEHSRALRVFDDLNQDPLSIDQHALVDLEIGSTYLAMGDTTQGFALYTMIDSTYKHTDASAKGYYRRGLMYEQQRLDYKTARDYYNKAKSEFPGSEITPLAARKTENFDHFFNTSEGIKKSRDLYVQALFRDSSMAASASLHPAPSLATEAPSGVDTTKPIKAPAVVDVPKKAFLPPDVIKEQLQVPVDEIPQGASETLRRRLSDRDLFRDADEEAPLPVKSVRPDARSVASGGGLPGRRDSLSAPAAPAAVVQVSRDSAVALLASGYFELGGIYFLELNRPDSAMIFYEKIVREFPTSSYVPRALYGMAEIRATRHDSTGVDSLYKVILKRYGETEYAAQVRKVLGMEAGKVRVDSIESEYQRAEKFVQSGKPREGIKIFKRIASSPRRSPLKPKATYAVGFLYETVLLNNDSAAAWYKHLSSQFPGSVYAAEVKPKLAVRSNPENLNQFIKAKKVESSPKAVDSVSQKQPEPERPRPTAIDRIKARLHEEELNQGSTIDSTDEDEPTPPDEEDPPDPDDDDNN
jgi:tetratricopeptide (TPR) repeat protein